jgi:hypothetical protein
MIFPPFFQSGSYIDLTQALLDACAKGRLALTVPWVVEFLALVDPLAPLSAHYAPLLQQLRRLLRLVGEHFL